MTLQTCVRQGCLVVKMPSEVSSENAESLRWELREMCRTRLERASRDGVSAVVVDWSEVPYLTLAGAALLDDLRQRVLESGVQLRIVATHGAPRAMLRIVGLNDVLAVHDSVGQALAAGGASGEGRGRPEIGKTS